MAGIQETSTEEEDDDDEPDLEGLVADEDGQYGVDENEDDMPVPEIAQEGTEFRH